MISDVLSDALFQIEDWQLHFAENYGVRADQIERVKEAMALLLVQLDTPPEMTPEMWIESTISQFLIDPATLERLDSIIYRVKRKEVVQELGQTHPLVQRLAAAEAEAVRQISDPSPAS